VRLLLPLFRDATVLLDALAMDAVESLPRFDQPVLLTPHAGEMAHLTGRDKEDLQDEPGAIALRQATAWHATVVMKGRPPASRRPTGACGRTARTHRDSAPRVGRRAGRPDRRAGGPGRACEQAATWGVALHARAGRALAARLGVVGYLARELAAQVPGLMAALSPRAPG
jgi:NAD(P)H-hydrate repair Nnr-like enzyme with NAD(P)H-hydrate dehydratase domain